MPLPRHLPHVIYATALTSLALHLLGTRKANAAKRQAAQARISLLEGLETRLRSGEDVSDEEVNRVKRLAREGANAGEEDAKEAENRGTEWKTVVLGRSGEGQAKVKEEEERLLRMVEEAFKKEGTTSR